MKILVTGGSGFIGSALVLHLLGEAGHQVVNVDALTYAANPRSLAAVEGDRAYAFVHADIRDAVAMAGVFAEHSPDAVVNLAAESHVDRSLDAPGAFLDTNVTGTYVMLEAAREHWQSLDEAAKERFRFLQVSTDEVHGDLPLGITADEAAVYAPSSPYAASKAAGDHLAMAWHRSYGLPVMVSNCTNNYGPRQFPEKLIPLIILNALAGEPLPVYGDGRQVRDWLYVTDHASALAAILERGEPGRKYNVSAECERENIAIINTICRLLDDAGGEAAPHVGLIRHVADRPGHDRRYALDASRIRNELGWAPRESLESGLAKTVAWYLDNRDWWRPLREAVYDGARLGLARQGESET
jgi:dTDP-glucose 4,6-dehydratase